MNKKFWINKYPLKYQIIISEIKKALRKKLPLTIFFEQPDGVKGRIKLWEYEFGYCQNCHTIRQRIVYDKLRPHGYYEQQGCETSRDLVLTENGIQLFTVFKYEDQNKEIREKSEFIYWFEIKGVKEYRR